MIKVKQAVIVEGKYDKIRLSSLIDGIIITTDGFGIFKDREKMNMLRHLADTRGLLVLTDSDSAGFVIRNHLRACIPNELIKHAYIPDMYGKERRKLQPSREGKLGVEGMPTDVLIAALRKAGADFDDVSDAPEAPQPQERRLITRRDFFEAGLSGRDGSAQRRAELLQHLRLPAHMSTNSLLEIINDYMSWEDFARRFGLPL